MKIAPRAVVFVHTVDIIVFPSPVLLVLQVTVAVIVATGEGGCNTLGIVGACLCTRLEVLHVHTSEVASIVISSTRQGEGAQLRALERASIVVGASEA